MDVTCTLDPAVLALQLPGRGSHPHECSCSTVTWALLSTMLFFTYLTWHNRPNYRTTTHFFHYLLNWILAKSRFFLWKSGSCQNELDRITHTCNATCSGHEPKILILSRGSSIKRQNCGMLMQPCFSLNTRFCLLFSWFICYRGTRSNPSVTILWIKVTSTVSFVTDSENVFQF